MTASAFKKYLRKKSGCLTLKVRPRPNGDADFVMDDRTYRCRTVAAAVQAAVVHRALREVG